MPTKRAETIIAADAAVVAGKELRQELKQDKSRLLKDVKELNKEKKVLSENNTNLLAHNERLKVRAEFSIFGDGLLTSGSIAIAFLSVYGREDFSTFIQKNIPAFGQNDLYSMCLGAALLSALIGLGLKMWLWFRQITDK